jgi:hypothetical protein
MAAVAAPAEMVGAQGNRRLAGRGTTERTEATMNAHLNAPRWECLRSAPMDLPTGQGRWARRGRALVQAGAICIARAADALGRRRQPGEPTTLLPEAVGASDAELARLRWQHPTGKLDDIRWSGAIAPVGWRW